MWRVLGVMGVALSLVACQSMPQPDTFTQQPYQTRQHQLANIDHWAFVGKFSIRVQGTDSGSIHWAQNKQHYEIHLFGPMHMGSVKLEGNTHQVTLWKKADEPLTDKNVEHLLFKAFNWQLPVSALPYWLLGRLKPHMPSEKMLDQYNHISWLKQQGWEVNLSKYTPLSGVDLPTHLELINGQMKVKLVIKEWVLD